MLIFAKNNKTNNTKRNKNIVLIFLGPTRINLNPTYFYSKLKISIT